MEEEVASGNPLSLSIIVERQTRAGRKRTVDTPWSLLMVTPSPSDERARAKFIRAQIPGSFSLPLHEREITTLVSDERSCRRCTREDRRGCVTVYSATRRLSVVTLNAKCRSRERPWPGANSSLEALFYFESRCFLPGYAPVTQKLRKT